MTQEQLMRRILEAQLNKPSTILTGTSNWAAYMAREIEKQDEPSAEPELEVYANTELLKSHRV